MHFAEAHFTNGERQKIMTSQPVSLAILWHMHQPFYKDLVTGEYILPSLLLQIEDYVNNNVTDTFLDLTLKEPGDLSFDDRIFILQNFFMANWDNMVKPYPRYQALRLKRGRFVSHAELAKVVLRFSTQELLDLQVWFNLTWFGFISKHEDPAVKELIAKGKYFTRDDKQT